MNVSYLIVWFIVVTINKAVVLSSYNIAPNVIRGITVDSAENVASLTTEKIYNIQHKIDQAYVSLTENKNSALVNSSSTLKVFSDFNVTELSDILCPPLEDGDGLTQTELINRLTASCRYDRFERPHVTDNASDNPVKIYIRIYICVIQNQETSDLQFTGLIRMRYNDSRLQFTKYATNRTLVMGESSLRDLIWVPHIFVGKTSVLGTNDRDILITISSTGSVIISSRVQDTLYCQLKFKKFPFDERFCPTVLESWLYNSSELLLHWEQSEPVVFDPKMHFTEYALRNIWTNESLINVDFNDLHGAFAGNYSSISFTFYITRQVGYFVMDYFLPSIMIVAISWVSFWLQADQTPARTTLGCTTLLSFITLASSQDNNFPKVSNVKISEFWFFGCTCFIFGSLLEFAFVNTIWRRNHSVEVKKVKSKYILKSTLTPNMERQKMKNVNYDNITYPKMKCEHYGVESPVTITVDEEAINKFKFTKSTTSQSLSADYYKNVKRKLCPTNCWATMTPHEVSMWIDKKARFVFPLAFIVFNAFFWAFVYCL